ncbi:copper amine oxidase N-terminal domain-containing protein [Paenibacillus athensensis]|uniref:Copper amine oxidase-like N-terminal domain-containing protein n=1 Tax=Paenibacillus athensensis TaxID=1967502 RepID=A0A4Y8PZB7_9BACL|nr:copper amine oxidase N-terminal domain-containing protein [Paenibacillus athensensis]MCD1257886.1 copper amine oxidase N-terminal domain-containing protein [Paenibacillus athensensis]
MQKRKFHTWACACALLLAVLLTGCQAVQGLDIGQVLVNASAHQSNETQGTMQIEFVPAEDSEWGAGNPLAELFKQITIDVHSAKTEDFDHMSMDADLVYSKGKIPFRLVLDGDDYIIDVKGSKKPIVVKTNRTPDDAANTAAQMLSAHLEETLRSKYAELVPATYKLFTDHAPNPATVSVTQVSEQIHGETLALDKLHAEVNGTELTDLLKGFLTSLLADKEGLKAFIGQMYDALMPVFKEFMDNNNKELQEDLSVYTANPSLAEGMQLIQAYMDNKTLVVEFLYTTLSHFLQKAVDQLDTALADGLAAKGYDALLSEQAYLKLDLFIDSSKLIRKETFDLQIPLDGAEGLSAIKMSGSMDIWNIGQAVKADSINTSNGTLDIDSVASLNGYELLNNFDKQSDLYKLLKDDLHVAKKEIYLFIEDDDSYSSEYDASHPYVNEDEVSMVAARDIAERMGGKAEWNEATRVVSIHDEWTDTDVELTIGSRTALVNGEEVMLDSPAVIKNGTTFVPLRFIAEALGASVEWNGEYRMVTITRD